MALFRVLVDIVEPNLVSDNIPSGSYIYYNYRESIPSYISNNDIETIEP